MVGRPLDMMSELGVVFLEDLFLLRSTIERFIGSILPSDLVEYLFEDDAGDADFEVSDVPLVQLDVLIRERLWGFVGFLETSLKCFLAF